ncbi:MAG: hypothetical protein ACREOE_16615, partial [Gemmatimonadales bacterium]
VFRSNDNGTILGLAAQGVGAAVISWLSVDPHRADISIRRLAHVSPRVTALNFRDVCPLSGDSTG